MSARRLFALSQIHPADVRVDLLHVLAKAPDAPHLGFDLRLQARDQDVEAFGVQRKLLVVVNHARDIVAGLSAISRQRKVLLESPVTSMDTVRPAWLFEVASAFQRGAIVPSGDLIGIVLRDVLTAIPPPCSPVEELILDGLLARARTAIKIIDKQTQEGPEPLEMRALRLLHNRYADQLTYRMIGRELGCDPEYLEVLFRKRTGESIHTYLRRYRVSKAVEAIERGEKIEGVALQCGFRSKSGFIRACRAVTGSSPGHWRTQNSN